MQECKNLLPGILVFNRKYFPESNLSAFRVGATSFVMETIKCLIEYNCFSGLLLYKRDESIEHPAIKEEQVCGLKGITLSFNFRMSENDVRNVVRNAINLININRNIPPLVYYHTDTILQYHPDDIPCCVTHTDLL